MIYVVDTNVFSKALLNLDLTVFSDIYEPWSELIEKSRVISCDEVFHELERRFGKKDQSMAWLKQNRKCFQDLTNDEAQLVRNIYSSNKFREGVKEKNIREGNPEADAMLVAKAKVNNGVIVTDEKNHAPNSEKIPNIAVTMSVQYMQGSEFFRVLKNLSAGKDELNGVTIFDTLNLND